MQQGSALNGIKRVYYQLALNCTDPATGKRNAADNGTYWLVGLSLATGRLVEAQRLSVLLPCVGARTPECSNVSATRAVHSTVP